MAPYILSVLGDRQEMGHSIEGRTPLLDHHLFEATRRIPDGEKIRDGVEKHVLREAVRDRVTDEIYRRRKWPYLAPPLWIRRGESRKLDDLLETYCSREAIEKAGVFSYGALRMLRFVDRALLADCRLKRWLHAILTFVLTVQILEKTYVQEFDRSAIIPGATWAS